MALFHVVLIVDFGAKSQMVSSCDSISYKINGWFWRENSNVFKLRLSFDES